jgi:transitional endoplasmic reticulum ATPase
MDGAAGNVPDVVFIAATNHPEKIDPAALRGGRFTEKLRFETPGIEGMARFIDQWRAASRAGFDPAVRSDEIAKLLKGLPVPSVHTVLQEAVNRMIGRSKKDRDGCVRWKDIAQARRTIVGDTVADARRQEFHRTILKSTRVQHCITKEIT